MLSISEADRDFAAFVERFRSKNGIDLSQYKEGQMKRRLNSLRERKGFATFSDFFQAMMQNQELHLEFLDHMTINVSEFFRNPGRWEVLEKRILPELIANNNRIKCWSAACSMGEEPYSLVMALSTYMDLREIQVLATDLDRKAIEKAKRGKYQALSVKNVPEAYLTKYFNAAGEDYEISGEIKKCVRFQQHNLLADPFEQNFDLIICRNVLIYFTDEAKDALYDKFSKSLKSGGYFFIGGTEQIFHPQQFGLEPTDTFFYKKI